MRTRWVTIAVVAVLVGSTYAGSGRAAEPDVVGRIAFVRDGGLWVWENGETTRLLREPGVGDPRWSPDGETLLFVRNANSYSDLALLNARTGVVTQVTDSRPGAEIGSKEYTDEAVWVIDPAWSASGRIAYVSDAPGGTTPFALWLMEGPEADPYEAPLLTSEDNIDSVSLSGDGAIAAYVLRQRDNQTGISDISVWLRDLVTGETFVAARSSGEVFDPAVSPDGTMIAVAIRGAGGVTDVWLVDRATLDRTRVTRDAEALAPTWSPDGAWVAFLKLQDYQFEVWVAPVTKGKAGKSFKLFSAKGLDSRSGLSWSAVPDALNDAE